MCQAAKVVFVRSKAKTAAVGEDTGDTGGVKGLLGSAKALILADIFSINWGRICGSAPLLD